MYCFVFSINVLFYFSSHLVVSTLTIAAAIKHVIHVALFSYKAILGGKYLCQSNNFVNIILQVR